MPLLGDQQYSSLRGLGVGGGDGLRPAGAAPDGVDPAGLCILSIGTSLNPSLLSVALLIELMSIEVVIGGSLFNAGGFAYALAVGPRPA